MRKQLGKQIVVLDGAFVHVGDCEIRDGFLVIENCKNIRIWGTTKGLGELRNGPTPKTIVDDMGIILVPVGRVIFLMQVNKGWL